MRVRIVCLLLIAAATHAEDLPITRLAGAAFKIADLEKTRQFYSGVLGLEEAFDLKDAGGAIESAFFKVNDDQYVEFSPGAAEGFELQHISLLTSDLKRTAELLEKRGVVPGKIAESADGNMYFAVSVPGQTKIDIVRYMPGSQQTEHRGKGLGARKVSDHLQHIGLPADDEATSMALFRDKLSFRELFRGGPTPGEVRWINLAAPGTTGDIVELMIMASQPAQGRRHLGFEVPEIKRAYKQLVEQGLPDRSKPNPGPAQNHRWILNLRDPNGIRVEFMGEPVAQ